MSQSDSNTKPDSFNGKDPDEFTIGNKNKNPFKFLDAYTKNDREIFFGREQELDEIYRKFYKSKILLVYGKSGTGKSSIINCGLVSRIPAEDILIVPVRCGKDPVGNLKSDLRKFSESDSSDTLDILQDIYEKNFKPVSLIFDQFEEIFILSSVEERKKLISELLKIIQSKIRVNLVLIFREEYFAGFSEFEDDIPNLYSNRVRIEKLNKNFIEEIIEKPCKNCQVKVEPGLAKKVAVLLSKETGEIELTWFQILMDKLYKQALEKNEANPEIRITDLDQIGDIGNLLGDFLNEQLLGMEAPTVVEAVLKAMISEDGTKRQITFDEILSSVKKTKQDITGEKVRSILIALVDRRIISEKDEHGNYEIKHDSLAIRIYERLTAEERKQKEIHQLIRNAHKQYLQVGTLINEQTLRYIEPYLNELSLSAEQEKFLKQSETEIKKGKKKIRNIWIAASIVLISIMIIFTSWAIIERNQAVQQKDLASQQEKFAEEQRILAEKQKSLALKANIIAEMAKDTALRAKEIAENELYLNLSNSLSVAPLKMNVLYRKVDNPVSITASGIDHNRIFPYSYDKNNNQLKANIIRDRDNFIIRDIDTTTSELIVGAYGITNNGDKIDLGSQLFRVKKLPVPYVSIGKNKMTGGNISAESLTKVDQLDINLDSDLKLDLEILGFSVTIFNNDGRKVKTQSPDKYFTNEQKNLFEELRPGNSLTIDEIFVDTNKGARRTYQPSYFDQFNYTRKLTNKNQGARSLDQSLFFRIGGDEIDKQNEKERVVNKLLELAEKYRAANKNDDAYFITKQAYEFDTTNKKSLKSLISVYSSLQNDFILNIPVLSKDYVFKILDLKRTVVVLGNTLPKEPDNKTQNGFNPLKQPGSQEFSDKLVNGLHRLDNRTKKMLDVFLFGRNISDAVYLKQKKQFALLVQDPVEIIFIDTLGYVMQRIDPKNKFIKKMYFSTDEKYLLATVSDRTILSPGKYDGRALFFSLDNNKQIYLWGKEYHGKQTHPDQFVYKEEVPVINMMNKSIVVSFPDSERLELWNFNGTFISGIYLTGQPTQVVITPDQKILVSLTIMKNGKYASKLETYDFNLKPLKDFDLNPVDYEWIRFTQDGQYILFLSMSTVKIYNYSGKLFYVLDNFASNDFMDNILIENEVLYNLGHTYVQVDPTRFTSVYQKTVFNFGQTYIQVFPIKNIAENIFRFVEQDNLFGEIPGLDQKVKSEIDRIINSK